MKAKNSWTLSLQLNAQTNTVGKRPGSVLPEDRDVDMDDPTFVPMVRVGKVLSKTSKGRYLDLKRASLTSQKGVNWKPIYALFVCSFRILFTKPYVLT